MTLSGKTWAAGEALGAEHRTDHNALADAVKNVRGFDVSTYGADPSNTAAANSTAFEGALADIEELSEDNYGTTLFVPFGTYQLARTLEIQRGMILSGVSGRMTGAGSRLVFADDTVGIIVHNQNTAANGVSNGQGSVIQDLALLGGGTSGDGIDIRATSTVVSRVYINGFGGNGVDITATAPDSGNANLWSLEYMRIQGCGGHGVYTDGADSNGGTAFLVDASSNGGWGIYDSSFLGNTYIACHAASNGSGPFKTDNVNARSVFVGCYSEANQDPSDLVAPTLVLGGLHGAGFVDDTVGRLHANKWEGDKFTVTQSGASSSVEVNVSADAAAVNVFGINDANPALRFYRNGSLAQSIEQRDGRLRLGGLALQVWDGDNGNRIQMDGPLDHNGDAVGFYGTAPVAQPSVTGTTDSEKVASILSALASLGLVSDDTT